MQLKVEVPFSKEQEAHVMDHLSYDTELGILQSEYVWIRGKIAEALAKQSRRLVRIEHAEMELERGGWTVTCTAESVL